MHRTCLPLRLCAFAFTLAALSLSSASLPFGGSWQRFMPPQATDSRLCSEFGFSATNTKFEVTLPPGDHSELTVVSWMQLSQAPGMNLTTSALWIPDPVQLSNPDLLAGAAGFPTNTVLPGTLTFADFAWQPYAPGPSSNLWPRGVYTLAGWSSNQITVALGGASVTLGPGPFTRNAVPGSGPDIVVTGTGLASVGLSRCPAAQWFSAIDGVRDENSGVLTRDSVITNELAFCSWRIRFSPTNQIDRSDIAAFGLCSPLSQEQYRPLPASGRTAYSSHGIYQFGLSGLGSGAFMVRLDGFAPRVIPRWLTDDELCRIKANDEPEIARRGIPRWR